MLFVLRVCKVMDTRWFKTLDGLKTGEVKEKKAPKISKWPSVDGWYEAVPRYVDEDWGNTELPLPRNMDEALACLHFQCWAVEPAAEGPCIGFNNMSNGSREEFHQWYESCLLLSDTVVNWGSRSDGGHFCTFSTGNVGMVAEKILNVWCSEHTVWEHQLIRCSDGTQLEGPYTRHPFELLTKSIFQLWDLRDKCVEIDDRLGDACV